MSLFRHVGSSQKVKLLTTIYVIYQLVSCYNTKYIFVKIERTKMSELSIFTNEISISSKEKCNY